MKTVVDALDLCRSFGPNIAVKAVSFSVKAGEIFGIIGPDGAGKSTLLRMLASILEPDSGKASVCGFDTVKCSDEIKNQIAYMSQKFGLYPDLTVEENIRFYADLYNVPENGLGARIEELLHFSYMHPFRKRLAGKLSGGMKQKLQLICALVHTPQLLILDEPTNGVDPVSRRDFWRMLQNLSERGVTIIVSTSYLDEAERCQHLALMHEGSFFTTGSLSDIIERSGFDIAVWRGSSARLLFSEMKKRAGVSGIRLFGDSIRIRKGAGFEDSRSLVNDISVAGKFSGNWDIDEKPGLEDIFVNYLEADISGTDKDIVHIRPVVTQFADGNSVKVTGISKIFGDFTAVESVNLEVKQGEIFGFLGPNGAGKSTTIRMLCGLLIPTSGQGTVAGYDLCHDSERIKKSIGYMSQKFSLYIDLTVAENIRFYGGIYGLSDQKLLERMAWAVRMTGLQGFENRQVNILSLGIRQRLALACSLLHEPAIVFLDEPTSGVDPLTRRQFWGTIRDLSHNGITVFVTTHYMEEAEYCDRIAFINSGRLMACGSPASLKAEVIRHNILLIDCQVSAEQLDKLRKMPGVHDVYFYGNGLHVVTDNDNSPAGVKEILGDNPLLHERISRVLPGMEDVFVQLSASHFSNDGRKEFKG